MLKSNIKWAISCYIPIINIITCTLTSVRKVNDKFCRFHARQGIILFLIWIFTIFIALISQTLSLMLWGVTLLLHGSGMYIAYLNKETKIPIIGQFALKIPEFYLYTLLTGKKPENLDQNQDYESNKEEQIENQEDQKNISN